MRMMPELRIHAQCRKIARYHIQRWKIWVTAHSRTTSNRQKYEFMTEGTLHADVVTVRCNQPETFASDLGDDQSRYLFKTRVIGQSDVGRYTTKSLWRMANAEPAIDHKIRKSNANESIVIPFQILTLRALTMFSITDVRVHVTARTLRLSFRPRSIAAPMVLGVRGRCVNDLATVVTWQWTAGSRARYIRTLKSAVANARALYLHSVVCTALLHQFHAIYGALHTHAYP